MEAVIIEPGQRVQTVGDLRTILEGLKDDVELIVEDKEGYWFGSFCFGITDWVGRDFEKTGKVESIPSLIFSKDMAIKK